MARAIEPLREEWIPALSEFLRAHFCSPGDYCDFADPEVLRWKFLEPRASGRARLLPSPDPWKTPRCFVVREENNIVADVGICTTEFTTCPGGEIHVPAVHMTDWLTSAQGASFGAPLMLRAFSLAPVQYACGCTPAAARVLLRAGYQEISQIPLYHRVLSRANSAVWSAIHGRQTALRQSAYLAFDLAQSFVPSRISTDMVAIQVPEFGPEVSALLASSSFAVTMTSRSPELLNYYCRYPKKNISGWLLKRSNQVVGFALLALIQKPKFRHGRIVECFLGSADPKVWAEAVAALQAQLKQMKPDLISCYASNQTIRSALETNGYFRRGKIPFYLRDPKNLVPRSQPFHLSYLEADLAYI
jgi:hypothetical protein